MIRSWLFLWIVTHSASGQVAWTQVAVDANSARVAAFDPVQGRPILYGVRRPHGASLAPFTAHWDGASWLVDFPRTSPRIREGCALATDAARRRVVLFGGDGGAQTWEWDGSDWTQRTSAHAPPGRSRHALAYDAARRRTVLFGGFGAAELGDTWEWDGTDWTQVQPASSPTARADHQLAYDATRQRVVLFGGQAGSSSGPWYGDTWEWDGGSWQQSAPANAPAPRSFHGLVADPGRGRLLLLGGLDGGGVRSDQWTWSGSDWAPLQPATNPDRFAGHAVTADPVRGTVVTLVGTYPRLYVQDSRTWEWNGSDWRLASGQTSPSPRYGPGMAYDPSRRCTVMFGGGNDLYLRYSDTWEWDGRRWTFRVSPSGAPPSRAWQVMGFDPLRARTVLFGGSDSLNFLEDTWEWDGSRWTEVPSTVHPSSPGLGNLVFDGLSGRLVGFEGAQLWEWDGIRWTRRSSATTPAGGTVAYDQQRQRLVNLGSDQTWEWVAQDWVRRFPATQPPGNGLPLHYDPARARVLALSGGSVVWEWDGTDWLTQQPGTLRASGWPGTAFDEHRGRVVLFGGDYFNDSGDANGDTWEYGPVHPAAATPYGQGCAGSAGVPALEVPLPWLPWLGDRFVLRAHNLRPGAAALVWLGGSRTAWEALPLPLDLTPIGMAGCALRVRPDVTLPVFNLTGTASVGVAVPGDPVLLGQELYGQALAVDLAANPFGATTSNGVAARIGAR